MSLPWTFHFIVTFETNKTNVQSKQSNSGAETLCLKHTVMLFMQRMDFHTKGGGKLMLRRSLRDVIVCDELFDVGQFLMKILAAFLLFPVAWKFLWKDEEDLFQCFIT